MCVPPSLRVSLPLGFFQRHLPPATFMVRVIEKLEKTWSSKKVSSQSAEARPSHQTAQPVVSHHLFRTHPTSRC